MQGPVCGLLLHASPLDKGNGPGCIYPAREGLLILIVCIGAKVEAAGSDENDYSVYIKCVTFTR